MPMEIAGTVTFECPPDLDNKNRYIEYLGQQGNADAPGRYSLLRMGTTEARTLNYPIFDLDGNIRLRIPKADYQRGREFVGENSRYRETWAGTYRSVNLARQSFKIIIRDRRAPLKLLLQKIAQIQASTAASGCHKSIRCWDRVGYEANGFEGLLLEEERWGAIEEIAGESSDGFSLEGVESCDGQTLPSLNPQLFCDVFSLTFVEDSLRYTY